LTRNFCVKGQSGHETRFEAGSCGEMSVTTAHQLLVGLVNV
jgi:hypothetical protein